MKKKVVLIIVVVLATLSVSSANELKQKKGFKVPENTAFVTTVDVNLDKTKDYIVQSPEKIEIYSGKDNSILFSIALDSKYDESFLIDMISSKFNRPDLLKDLNGNGVIDIPIRGLSQTDGEYLRIVDPKTGEQMLNNRFAPNSDNIFIYDVDGNDTVDVVIERLDSVLIFSSTVIIPSSVMLSNIAEQQGALFTYPNPTFNTSTILWKQLGSHNGNEATAFIVDMQGRQIRRISTEISENNAKFEWDGKGENNQDIDRGVYVVKVQSGRLTSEGKIVVAK